jgi:hypothetical protein
MAIEIDMNSLMFNVGVLMGACTEYKNLMYVCIDVKMGHRAYTSYGVHGKMRVMFRETSANKKHRFYIEIGILAHTHDSTRIRASIVGELISRSVNASGYWGEDQRLYKNTALKALGQQLRVLTIKHKKEWRNETATL